jgi:hypothetical protein
MSVARTRRAAASRLQVPVDNAFSYNLPPGNALYDEQIHKQGIHVALEFPDLGGVRLCVG